MKQHSLLVLLSALALATGALADPPNKPAPAAAKSPAAKPAPKPTAAAPKPSSAGAALVDINSASADELSALPGIGKAYAAAIIKGRPYANKAQLASKKVLPPKVYDGVQALTIAKQKK